MKRVVIESPFAGNTPEERAENLEYAKACMLDSLRRGEAPFASHLLYTQVLDDALTDDRELGIAAGLSLVRGFELTAVYIDRGLSPGMKRGLTAAGRARRTYVVRSIQGALDIPTALATAIHRANLAGILEPYEDGR